MMNLAGPRSRMIFGRCMAPANLQRTTSLAATTARPLSTYATATRPLSMPMKVGEVIPGLDIYKDKDPPVVLERSEYPEWVNKLAEPLISLAKLRKMRVEDATDEEKKRYLKLVRKLNIKEKNEESKKQ